LAHGDTGDNTHENVLRSGGPLAIHTHTHTHTHTHAVIRQDAKLKIKPVSGRTLNGKLALPRLPREGES